MALIDITELQQDMTWNDALLPETVSKCCFTAVITMTITPEFRDNKNV